MATREERLARKRQLMPQPHIAVVANNVRHTSIERLREAIQNEWQQQPPGHDIGEALVDQVAFWRDFVTDIPAFDIELERFKREVDAARLTGNPLAIATVERMIDAIERWSNVAEEKARSS